MLAKSEANMLTGQPPPRFAASVWTLRELYICISTQRRPRASSFLITLIIGQIRGEKIDKIVQFRLNESASNAF